MLLFRVVEQCGPRGVGVVGEVVEAAADVEGAGGDCGADGFSPEDAGLDRGVVGVGEAADGGGCGGATVGVVEELQGDGTGSHEGSVAGGRPTRPRHLLCGGGELRGRGIGAAAAEGPLRLGADVGRVAVEPGTEVSGDGGEPFVVGQVQAACGDVSDAPSHRCVIGPFAGAAGSDASADHPGPIWAGADLVGFVAGAQRIPYDAAEEDTTGPVQSRCHAWDRPHSGCAMENAPYFVGGVLGVGGAVHCAVGVTCPGGPAPRKAGAGWLRRCSPRSG